MLFGIVPRDGAVYSQQSAKSVYPLTIANCKENRSVNCNLLEFFTTGPLVRMCLWLYVHLT